MAGFGLRPPLFERLASPANDTGRAFDRLALQDSVHAELSRLFNTRRGPRALTEPPSILDYGIADWTALQQQRSQHCGGNIPATICNRGRVFFV